MKTKIEVLVKTPGCKPVINPKGDWIDLYAAEDVELMKPQSRRERTVNNIKVRDVEVSNKKISLGIAMRLPKGFEAEIRSRSSTYKNFKCIFSNCVGTIDNSYKGNDDIWRADIIALNDCKIKKGERIAQFRIHLSQYATVKQKLKWLFSNGIEIVEVDSLDDVNRGGFGTSGK